MTLMRRIRRGRSNFGQIKERTNARTDLRLENHDYRQSSLQEIPFPWSKDEVTSVLVRFAHICRIKSAQSISLSYPISPISDFLPNCQITIPDERDLFWLTRATFSAGGCSISLSLSPSLPYVFFLLPSLSSLSNPALSLSMRIYFLSHSLTIKASSLYSLLFSFALLFPANPGTSVGRVNPLLYREIAHSQSPDCLTVNTTVASFQCSFFIRL